MPFKKGDPNINRAGRAKRQPIDSSILGIPVPGDAAESVMFEELWRIVRNPKTPKTAAVSALREMWNRRVGTAPKAKPEADAINEPTARRLAELTERILIPRRTRCAKCNTHLVVDGKGNSVIDDRPDLAPTSSPEPSATAPELEHERGLTLGEQEEQARFIEQQRSKTVSVSVPLDEKSGA